MDMHRFSWTKNEFWWIFCRLKASEAAFWEHKCARWRAFLCPAGSRLVPGGEQRCARRGGVGEEMRWRGGAHRLWTVASGGWAWACLVMRKCLRDRAYGLHGCCAGLAVLLRMLCSSAAQALQQCCTGFAAVLRRLCSGTARALQQCCAGCAVVLHGLCRSHAVAMCCCSGG